jgi:ABC-type Mn2+/Zn2+ transport system ATPase subunit
VEGVREAGEMSRLMLQVKNLTVNRNGTEILKDLSFEVREGEVLVILGPNGAGKTTLLRALLGLLPYQGDVTCSTTDINYLPPQEEIQRKDIPLTIEEFFKLKRVSSGKIVHVFKSVGLDATLLKRRFGALSTGQFQRMIIAWALVDDPAVLLFDEPTSGIDVGGQDTVYSLLHRFWKERHLTILLVTHDLNIVWEHANTILCLNKTKLCSGTPQEVLTPAHLEKLYGTGIKFYTHSHEW